MKRGFVVAGALIAGGLVAGSVPAAASAPPDDGGASGLAELPADVAARLFPEGVGYPDQPDGVAWPTTGWPMGQLPGAVDVRMLFDTLDAAFAPGASVDSVVVIQGGELVVQRHRAGVDPLEPHISWSMAKSITQALIGILVEEGRLDLDAPAPVAAWSDPADPRHAITLADLLHMRAGLEWNEEYAGVSDVIELLFGPGEANRPAWAADKPLEFEPGEVWEYSTGTSMILAGIIADQVGYGEEGTAWVMDELFTPLGISNVEFSLDEAGTISGGSGINMAPADFAKFGYLYLRGGEWDGTQIVPEEWVDYARTPQSDGLEYGAHWWTVGAWSETFAEFPRAFQAQGFNGQRIVVIPEIDTVIVVVSNDTSSLPNETVAGLVGAFAPLGATS